MRVSWHPYGTWNEELRTTEGARGGTGCRKLVGLLQGRGQMTGSSHSHTAKLGQGSRGAGS